MGKGTSCLNPQLRNTYLVSRQVTNVPASGPLPEDSPARSLHIKDAQNSVAEPMLCGCDIHSRIQPEIILAKGL